MKEVSRIRGGLSEQEILPTDEARPARDGSSLDKDLLAVGRDEDRQAEAAELLANTVARLVRKNSAEDTRHLLEHVETLEASVSALQQAMSQIAASAAETQRRLDQLQTHGNTVGHIVEQVRDSVRRRPLIPRKIKSGVRKALSPASRAARAGARLRRVNLKKIMEEASRTSRRARKSVNGRWIAKVDRSVWLANVSRALNAQLRSKQTTLYTVNQRHPAIAGRRPRILHAIPNVFVGGSTQLIIDLFDHIGHKYEMHVMTSAFPPGGKHQGMIIHDLREPTTAEAIASLIKKFGADIVHVHYWGDVDTPWYEKVFRAAEMAGCLVVQNINTPVEPYFDPVVNEYIFVSNYIREVFGSQDSNERVIYPGIDLATFDRPKQMSPDAADSIGMVYRLERDKLNEDSIEPLVLVAMRRPQTRIYIIGDGSLFDPFMQRVVEAGVRDNFVFTGYVPYSDLPKYYSEFSVFVAPVWKESFGQVTPFAMSMGLAVAGNRVGALPEILESTDTLGETIEETADHLIALLDDPVRRAQLGERNREIALTKYAVETMCAGYDRAYSEVLGEVDEMPGFPPAEIFLS